MMPHRGPPRPRPQCRTTLPRDSELELVRTIERLCADPLSGQMLWLDLARFVQVAPQQRSMAA